MENDGYIRVDESGKMESCIKGQIEQKYLPVIEDLVEKICEIGGSNIRSILLRGSVACNKVIPGVSDIDFVIILKSTSEKMTQEIEMLAAKEAKKYQQVFTTIDLSCYEYAECIRPENNRLLMNLKLTGRKVYGEDMICRLPDLYCNEELAKRIYVQTVQESQETLDRIKKRERICYMGIERKPSFLCVWFMRSFCRGLIAFSMLETKRFSLNVGNSCEEFLACYPEYEKQIRECQKLEREPSEDWEYLESICEEVLLQYCSLGRKNGW